MEPLLPHRAASQLETKSHDDDMLRYNSQMSSASSIPLENDVEVARLVTPTEFSQSPVPLSPYSLWKRFFVSLLIFLVGWHLPKSFAPSSEMMQQRSIPLQTTSSGDVILDLQLNHPLVHPPTISCTSRVFLSLCADDFLLTCQILLLALNIAHLLIVSSIWIPVMIIALMSCCCNFQFGTSVNNSSTTWWKPFILHLSILLACIGLSEGTTQLLKIYVLRRRPNFYALCQFNPETKACTGTFDKILEAQMSFPSGHSSLSFCGMTFLSLYLQDQIVPTSVKPTSLSPSCIMLNKVVCLLPYAWALFVAASRVHDFWHFASDVIAGSLLGTWASWWVWHNCLPSKE